MKLNKNLIKGSIVLMIAFNTYNALNFLFHFGMARLLSVVDYGILATLFSIIYVFTIFTESIQIVVMKYSAKEDEKGKLKNILKRSLNKAISASSVIFVLYLLIAIPLSRLIKIDYFLVAFTGLMVFFAFLPPITRGLMQGKKRFRSLGINMILESSIKLSLALGLVWIGWNVWGAMVATIVGAVIAFAFSFLSIKDIIKSDEKGADIDDIYGYSRPAFTVNLAILLFFSIDVIIAKIFFSDVVAGSYAIASILGKIIFMGTQPISRAMFPISAGKDSSEKKSQDVFLNSFLLVAIAIVAALLVFYFFPNYIVKIFSGRYILDSIGVLFYVGIATSMLSMSNLILLHKLSLGKVKGSRYLLIIVIAEVLLLSYFSQNLYQFSIAFITAATAFLWASIFLVKNKK